jgi:hypothetical protein
MRAPSTHLKLTGDHALAATVAFSLWKMPGYKMLLHDGAGVLLSAQINHQIVRLTLDRTVEEARPFAFSLSARPDVRAACPAIKTVLALFASSMPFRSPAKARPNRQFMLHMRALQALDGEAAGASHREIAEVIFGAQDIFERWSTNSELRAQIRYLLRRGHPLVSSGYRQLPSK